MLYQRSLDIERRLEDVLQLIRSGDYSTPRIAEQLGVSIPTVSRDVTALRERGHNIRSHKTADGWRYVLATETNVCSGRNSFVGGKALNLDVVSPLERKARNP